jgi:hypothetical protein
VHRSLWALLSIVAVALVVQDFRLGPAYSHGEMNRFAIDRQEGGIVTAFHYTQVPNSDDAALLLCWGVIHIAVVAGYVVLSRRSGRSGIAAAPSSTLPISE